MEFLQKLLVFDIETAPIAFEEFSESQQEYLLRGAKTDEEIEKKKFEMALSPFTSQIVCIGMKLVEKTEQGFETKGDICYSLKNELKDDETEKIILGNNIKCVFFNEKKLLDNFWQFFRKYIDLHIITFNGRNFDCPFVMLRTSILGGRPYRNLMSGTKFNYPSHTDLADELTFYNSSSYGATRRYNFDFYTRAYGLTSPKSEGIDGSMVGTYFKEGKIREISEYCMRDVEATWQLYQIWLERLKF